MSKVKKHQRDCPVLGRLISSAECGSGRGTAYACPEQCPYFPFTPANYDQHLALEKGLIGAAYLRGERHLSEVARLRMSAKIRRRAKAYDQETVIQSELAWTYHCERDAEGRSFGERWLEDKASGLKNDERFLLSQMNQVRPVLLEIHRIVDEMIIEGVDLLTGEALRVLDRSAASSMGRYFVVLVWLYPTPHYQRLSGTAMLIPDLPDIEPQDWLREIIAHLGGPSGSREETYWLAEHFLRVLESIQAVGEARLEAMLGATDMQWITTEYAILPSAGLRELFERQSDMFSDNLGEEDIKQGFDQVFVWLEAAPLLEQGQTRTSLDVFSDDMPSRLVLGRVLLGGERLRLEAQSEERNGVLRTQFEKLAAGQVKFLGEQRKDLVAEARAKLVNRYDASLVPSKLIKNPTQLGIQREMRVSKEADSPLNILEMRRQQLVALVDSSIPALDGLTPRQAAANFAYRTRLVRLMKTHIRGCDSERRQKGLDLDLNPQLAELGLHELISVAPPLGKVEENFQARAGIPVVKKLSERDLAAGIKSMHRRFSEFEDAADAVDRVVPWLLDLVSELTSSLLKEEEVLTLEILVVRAFHVLWPGNSLPPDLEEVAIVEGMQREISELEHLLSDVSGGREEAVIERWLHETPQPLVMEDLSGVLYGANSALKPDGKATVVILALLKSLVAELSWASVR